jgi:hypothetical protein
MYKWSSCCQYIISSDEDAGLRIENFARRIFYKPKDIKLET